MGSGDRTFSGVKSQHILETFLLLQDCFTLIPHGELIHSKLNRLFLILFSSGIAISAYFSLLYFQSIYLFNVFISHL